MIASKKSIMMVNYIGEMNQSHFKRSLDYISGLMVIIVLDNLKDFYLMVME